MRPLLTFGILLFAPVYGYTQAPKPCQELKAEIAKKLEANKVKSYSLEVVTKDKEEAGKVVGTCEGGTKNIVYRKTSTPPQPTATETSKP